MKPRPATIRRFHLPAWIVCLVLLAGVSAEAWTRPGPLDARDFHARIRQTVAELPLQWGPWQGVDVALPSDVVSLLNANALCSRMYTDHDTGASMWLLLEQCPDARQMTGHFPTLCFAANGWTLAGQNDGEFRETGQTIPYREYLFSRPGENGPTSVAVIHFIVLHDARFGRELSTIRDAAADLTRRSYGAAQVELTFPASMPPDERLAAARSFYQAHAPLLAVLAAPSTRH